MDGDSTVPLVHAGHLAPMAAAVGLLALLLALVRYRRRKARAAEGAMLTTNVELWFVRHAQSVNNELSTGALNKLLYVLCNACLSSRDPQLTPEALQQCAAAAKWLKPQGQPRAHFDLVVSSMMVRAMQTAMHTFCDAGLAKEVVVAPFVSEVPMWLLCYPRLSNMPFGRAAQLDRLRALRRAHADGRVPLDFSLVGGDAGDNRDGLPPSMPDFLRWLWAQPRVQALVRQKRRSGGLVRIAVVSHGTFLRRALRLTRHPRNHSIWSARLRVGADEALSSAGEPGWRCRPSERGSALRVGLTSARALYAGSTG